MARRLPTLKTGRRHVYRANLAPMPDGRLWCVTCCAVADCPNPAPDDDPEGWRCERCRTGYWYHSDGETVDGVRRQRQRLARLRDRGAA